MKVVTSLRPGRFSAYLAALLGFSLKGVILTLALTVLLSMTEGIGLVLLVPLLQLVGLDVQQGTLGWFARPVRAMFAAIGLQLTLPGILAIYVLVAGTHALCAHWQATASSTLQNEFVAYLRGRLYHSIANTSWGFFIQRRSSEFTHALTAELEHIGGSTYYLLGMISNATIAFIYLVLALQVSAPMTALVLLSGMVLFVLLRGRVRAARLSGQRLSSATGDLYAATQEHLDGMKVTKSYGAEDRHADIFARLTDHLARLNIATARNHVAAKAWFDVGSVVILSCILYVSLDVLAIPSAAVLLLVFIFFRLMPKLSGIHQSYQSFMSLLPSFVAVARVQEACDAAAESRPRRSEDIKLRREIQFEQVSFSYGRDDEAEVIHDLDLTIRAGMTTAIAGPSGAGKSTIADLVIGLITPSRGRVLVDGLPLSPERMRSWRDQIGYVAQDTFLFHDTVRANLLWARPDADAEAIRRAVRLAAADGFIDGLPAGLDTVLGDRGVRLSGGERQRLALARAVLREPSLLILDEATSSLDSENERRIQSAIEELHGHLTILIITHRLSTIRGADVIYVLERGRLVESDDWDGLITRSNGRFRALCQAQGVPTAANSDSRSRRLDHGLPV